MNTGRFASQFAWVSLGRLAGAGVQVLMLVVLARHAGPSSFGIFSVVYGLAIVLQATFDLGVTTLITKERAASPDAPIILEALRLNRWTTLALFVVSGVMLTASGYWISAEYFALVPISLWVACERNTDTWLGISLADGDAHINTTNLLGRRVLALCLYFLMYGVGLEPLLGIAISLSLSSVAFLVVAHQQLGRRLAARRDSARSEYGMVIRRARPYWINTLGTQLRNLDMAVVSMFAGSIQAGYYGVASRATSPMRILSTSMAAVMLPAAARTTVNGSKPLLQLILGFVLALGALYGVLVIMVPVLVPLLLGDAYDGAIVPLQIVVGGLVFAALASLLGALLQGHGLQWFVAQAAISMTITCLGLGIIGAFWWGASGAAVALAGSFVIQSSILAVKVISVTAKEWRGSSEHVE